MDDPLHATFRSFLSDLLDVPRAKSFGAICFFKFSNSLRVSFGDLSVPVVFASSDSSGVAHSYACIVTKFFDTDQISLSPSNGSHLSHVGVYCVAWDDSDESAARRDRDGEPKENR